MPKAVLPYQEHWKYKLTCTSSSTLMPLPVNLRRCSIFFLLRSVHCLGQIYCNSSFSTLTAWVHASEYKFKIGPKWKRFTLKSFLLKFSRSRCEQAGVPSQTTEKWQKPEFIAQLASGVPGASLLVRNGYNQNWKNKMSSSCDGWGEYWRWGDKVLLNGAGTFVPMGVWGEANNFIYVLWYICI